MRGGNGISGVTLECPFLGARGIGEQRGRIATRLRAHRNTNLVQPTCDTCGIDCAQWQPHPDGFECLVCGDVLNDDGSVLYSADDDADELDAERLEFNWAGEDRRRVSAGCTASWHYMVSSPATTVEAHPITQGGKPTTLADAYWVVVRVPGTIVDGWLPSWDRGERERRVGQPHEIRMQMYGHVVRNAVADGSEHWTHTPAQVAS